jgi:hypothetical protein
MKTHITRINYIRLALLALAIAGFQSCTDDFLDENLTTARSTEYYKTEEGIIALAQAGYYRVLAFPYGGEMQYSTTSYGTDEFVVGGDTSNATWNNYTSAFQSVVPYFGINTTEANTQWDYLYLGINVANSIISYANEIESTNAAVKQVSLGEGYFFRAFSYLRLVRQYGGVPLKLNVTTAIENEYTRATAEQVYAQVIDDFTKAYNLLPNTGAPAKITKDAAAHYLAKAYLSRASELNDTWNSATKQADLNQVKTLCNEVIANHPLAANYRDLWSFTAPNSANETLPELILSVQFTNDLSATATNWQHVAFVSRYDDLPFMKRDISGMRPYSRLAPSYFTYEAFDVVNDSRLWKSFRTKHRLNNASGTTYVNGDLGIMYVVNDKNDNTFTQTKYSNTIIYQATGKTIPTV